MASAGRLTLVGTPIGNLGDISPRAVRALSQADTICAEDTRVASRLLAACGIEGARLERSDENVLGRRAAGLVERMLAGEQMAFISDAGMPAVADPGARLVDACREAGVEVDVVPGPSAVTCALAQAGFACESFYFGGFLPRKDGARDRLLSGLATLPAALVFYESPHRTVDSLRALARTLGGRRVAVARELTKVHQEVLRGKPAELADELDQREQVKGEVVLVVDAPSDEELAQAQQEDFDLDQEIKRGLAAGTNKSALAKQLASRTSLSRGQVYDRIRELAQ